jgi:alanine-synthesizing transaminase
MLPAVFSRQTEFPSEPNVVVRRRSELVDAGRPILDLAGSNPTVVGLDFDTSILAALADPRGLRYAPEPLGSRQAREVLSRRWHELGHAQALERIVLSASTSEAYSHLFKLLCDPGDEVLVPRPSYPLFEHLAQLEHVRLSTYQLEYDGRWYIDLDSLKLAQTPRTKAVVLVSPNNPTGSVTCSDELSAIAALGLPIISDEVFSGFLFDQATARHRSALSQQDCLVFVLDGLSKALGLPQCKLAWTSLSGPQNLVEVALDRLEVISDAFLSVSTPIQAALPELLRREAERHGLIQSRLEGNLRELKRLVSDSAVTLLHLDGGWSAVLQLPNTSSETEWVLALLEQDDLWVQPGWFFDFAREAYVVVSLLTPHDEFAIGIERLVRRANAV